MSVKISKNQLNNFHNNTPIFAQASYSSPLPPASEFIKYNEAVPNAGDRILLMAENEAKNRHELQQKTISISNRNSLIGMIFAFILALCFLLTGAYIVLHSSDNVAITIAGALFGLSGMGSIIKTMIDNNKK